MREDFLVAFSLQQVLISMGSPQASSDLLIAAMCINRGEELVTKDEDFKLIGKASRRLGRELKVSFA